MNYLYLYSKIQKNIIYIYYIGIRKKVSINNIFDL